MLIWLVENGVEVNAQDKAGRTALHQIFTASTANVAAAGMQLSSAGDVGGAASGGASKTSSVRRRGSLAKMASSRLSLATNSQGAALSAALALVRKGADMSRKAYPPRRQEGGGASTAAAAAAVEASAEVGLSPLDLCDEEQVAQLVAMTGSIGKVDYFPLLHEPAVKVPNCCYVSMLVEKSSMQSTAGLQRPFLTASLYKLEPRGVDNAIAIHHRVEAVQSITEPCVTRPDYLWWGSTIHLQSPLENLATHVAEAAATEAGTDESGASSMGGAVVVLLELKDMGALGAGTQASARSPPPPPPQSSSNQSSAKRSAAGSGGPGQCLAWTLLDVGKRTVDTKDNVQLEMYEYPVDLRKRKLEPVAMFLSVDVILTRPEADVFEASDDEGGDDPTAESEEKVQGLSEKRSKEDSKTDEKPPLPSRTSMIMKRKMRGGKLLGEAMNTPDDSTEREESNVSSKSLSGSKDIAGELVKLSEMFAAGKLGEEEFAEAKQKVLSSP